MRMRDRRAGLMEQLQPRLQRQCIGAAVLGDVAACDVLHRHPRAAVVDAAIKQARDVRVGELGEDAALVLEAFGMLRGFGMQQLDRGLLGEATFRAFGQINLTHAATADHAHDAPCADAGVGGQRCIIGGCGLSLIHI